MTFSPVVSSAGLSKDKVVWSENLTERSRSDGVHGTWFQINQNGTRYILSTFKLYLLVKSQIIINIEIKVKKTLPDASL